ncbi:MAG: aminoacyl-tRNA hydrolase, partial [Vicinamibacteria bacterium]
GNPGARYARTRHNVGFLAATRVASAIGARFRLEGRRSGAAEVAGVAEVAEVAMGRGFGEDIVVARPLTYMNSSGEAAVHLARRHGADAADFVVLYDDIALPLGRLRLRAGGSSGGHRGMQSVITHLGTAEVPRVRMGIMGQADPDGGAGSVDLKEYVLREFDPGEWPVVRDMVERSSEAVALAVSRGITLAANRFNRVETPCSREGA